MKVTLEYRIDIGEVGVGSRPLQAILISKLINCEGPIRSTADGEIVAIISLLTHWEVPNRVRSDRRVGVISFHQVRKFRESILCYEL